MTTRSQGRSRGAGGRIEQTFAKLSPFYSIHIDWTDGASRLGGMPSIPVRELIPVLQVAIGPVILISGVGLLLLTLTNRFGRAVDRSRALGREVREVGQTERQRLARQVEILYRRAQVIRLSIIMAAVSLLLTAVLIIVLFVTALAKLEAGFVIVLLFVCCMASLIVSLVAFLRDIHLSLQALKLDLGYIEQQ
jgi:hypothetical protein